MGALKSKFKRRVCKNNFHCQYKVNWQKPMQNIKLQKRENIPKFKKEVHINNHTDNKELTVGDRNPYDIQMK